MRQHQRRHLGVVLRHVALGHAAGFVDHTARVGDAGRADCNACGRGCPLTQDGARGLVGAQALEYRMAYMAPARPFGKRYFGHQFGQHPVHAAQAGGGGQRAVVGAQCLQLRGQRGQRALAEACAHIARMAQCAVVAVHGQHQRAKAASATLRVGVAGHHKFLAQAAFELDPVGRAARCIGRVAPLADHALKAQLAR